MSMGSSQQLSIKEKQFLSLRKTSANKMIFKEKFVQIYEAFFQGSDMCADNVNFWDDLFLLKVNRSFIESEFEKLSGEAILNLKENINGLFHQCIDVIKQDNPIRVFNALQTMGSFIRGVYKTRHGDSGFDVINILFGFDSAEQLMQSLVETLNKYLTGATNMNLRHICLKFLLTLVTAADNVSSNTLLEYIMINSVYESLIQILGTTSLCQTLGNDAVLLLTLLIQYRKYESVNPYIVKLSILDDELAMTGFAAVVSQVLSDFNREFQNKQTDAPVGWFSSFTNMVGNMLVGEEKTIELVKANDSVLLALYEAIHLNRNFFTALTHTHTPTSPFSSFAPSALIDASISLPQSDVSQTMDMPISEPTNLLVTFLEYSSIIMQDTKDITRHNNAKLCLIILTVIAEDQYANSIMHDVNMNFRVTLHRTPMRHRKLKTDLNPASRPLILSLIDLMTEFIHSHMMKNFPMELYLRAIGVIHRVLCHQKKCRIRLSHKWTEMWAALINLLKFILSHETHLSKKHNIFHLCIKVVNVFNLFITYGDTFLPSPNSYDELYYEIMRMHQVFDNLHSMALRYASVDSEHKDTAVKLTGSLVNIRAIIGHFSPKVDMWASANGHSTLTEEQVLNVVRENYDSLTLKLQSSLDQYERYSEKPRETAFFTQLVRTIVSDVRKSSTDYYLSQDDVLKLFGTIT